MTVRDYIRKTGRIARKHGALAAAKAAADEAVAKTLLRQYVAAKERQLRRSAPAQKTLLEELWQQESWTLLVFDTGRYDYMAPLFRDYWQGDVTETYSAARDTFEWISQVWQGDHDDVTYISGMVPVSDRVPDFDTEDFKRRYNGINPGDNIGDIHPLWKTHWDRTFSTVTPEDLTEYALEYTDRDKLVVHYNQPHSPYIGSPQLLGHSDNRSAEPHNGRPNDEPIWERVRTGDVSDEYLRMAYWGNAVRAIEAAEPLIEARENVIATADHGEALGEYGMYTHDRSPHPMRRSVPWMPVDGVRTDDSDRDHSSAVDVNEQLEALGYV